MRYPNVALPEYDEKNARTFLITARSVNIFRIAIADEHAISSVFAKYRIAIVVVLTVAEKILLIYFINETAIEQDAETTFEHSFAIETTFWHEIAIDLDVDITKVGTVAHEIENDLDIRFTNDDKLEHDTATFLLDIFDAAMLDEQAIEIAAMKRRDASRVTEDIVDTLIVLLFATTGVYVITIIPWEPFGDAPL